MTILYRLTRISFVRKMPLTFELEGVKQFWQRWLDSWKLFIVMCAVRFFIRTYSIWELRKISSIKSNALYFIIYSIVFYGCVSVVWPSRTVWFIPFWINQTIQLIFQHEKQTMQIMQKCSLQFRVNERHEICPRMFLCLLFVQIGPILGQTSTNTHETCTSCKKTAD